MQVEERQTKGRQALKNWQVATLLTALLSQRSYMKHLNYELNYCDTPT